ncbi:hypothetical protein BH10ACT1_BH10ACT1_09420 [soil metagenome]
MGMPGAGPQGPALSAPGASGTRSGCRWVLVTEPAPDPPHPVADAAAVLGAVPGVIALIDRLGIVLWINDHVTGFSGHQPHELIGTNLLDHLDLDTNALALESVGYAMDHPGVQLPTVLGFRAKDGSVFTVEAIANNRFDDEAVGAMVVHLAPYDERAALDRMLGSLAAGDDLAISFGHLHQVARGATLRSESAVVLATGAIIASLPAAAAPIHAGLEPDGATSSPWAEAASTGAPVLASGLDGLAPEQRDAARAAGHAACWAFPVPHLDDEGTAAVLVFWRREEGWPEPNAVSMAGQLVRLAQLAIDRHEHRRQLLHAATHDHLTGLANRAHFYDILASHLAGGASPVGVLYLDLDRFKQVNDEFGHGHGDQVLRVVADRLLHASPVTATVGRLGGDEFAACVPDADLALLSEVANEVLEALSQTIRVDDQEHRIAATIGVASSGTGARPSTDALVREADGALLEAKASAKGSWRLAGGEDLPSTASG